MTNLRYFLSKYNILYKYQFGLNKNFSTEQAICLIFMTTIKQKLINVEKNMLNLSGLFQNI